MQIADVLWFTLICRIFVATLAFFAARKVQRPT